MKIFEYVGYKKYSLRVAAAAQEAADEKLRQLGEKWIDSAEEIGVDLLDGDDLLSVEEVDDDGDLEDLAHVIVASAITPP